MCATIPPEAATRTEGPDALMTAHMDDRPRLRTISAPTVVGLAVLLSAGPVLDAQSGSVVGGGSAKRFNAGESKISGLRAGALSPLARQHLFASTQRDVPNRGTGVLPCNEFAPDRVVVRFGPDVDTDTIERELRKLQLVVSYRALSPLNLYRLWIDPVGGTDALFALLDALERLDLALQASVDCIGEGSNVDHQTGSRGLPSDTHVAEQWHLHGPNGVDATQAWEITKGSEEIVVAIVDSGYVAEHPEFADRIYESPNEDDDGVDDDSNGYIDDQSGWDFVAYDEYADDEHRHGSWVAGMFGAAANNGFGVSGLDHFARIMPIKVLDSTNSGFTSDLIAALDFALLHPEVRVVNLSLINYPDEPMLHDALQALASQAILVACAGNAGVGTADGQFPGAYPETISVAWTDENGVIAFDSSSGSTVDFSAPGLNVVTINPLNYEDQYHVIYGCSFATPLMSAAASLTLSIRPQTDASDLRFLLRRTVVDEGESGWDEYYGWGRLDLDDLLIEAERLVFQGDFESGDTSRWK